MTHRALFSNIGRLAPSLSRVVFLGVTAVGAFGFAQSGALAQPDDSPNTVLLRYQFAPGETICWDVEHRALVKTTVSGTTQTAETITVSKKVWEIDDVRGDGTCIFRNFVEDIDMIQRVSGRREVRYRTGSSEDPPPGMESVAETVGKPLAEITINDRGEVLDRKQLVPEAAQAQGPITVLLPEGEIAVGESWTDPLDIELPLPDGRVTRVRAQQKYTLEEVQTGVATISLKTQVLTPIDNPAVEAQLVQRLVDGTIRFDIDAGRVLSQELDVDREVVGFRGDASSLHYTTRFTEELSEKRTSVAAKPDAGSEAK